jgi:hypothetical protein
VVRYEDSVLARPCSAYFMYGQRIGNFNPIALHCLHLGDTLPTCVTQLQITSGFKGRLDLVRSVQAKTVRCNRGRGHGRLPRTVAEELPLSSPSQDTPLPPVPESTITSSVPPPPAPTQPRPPPPPHPEPSTTASRFRPPPLPPPSAHTTQSMYSAAHHTAAATFYAQDPNHHAQSPPFFPSQPTPQPLVPLTSQPLAHTCTDGHVTPRKTSPAFSYLPMGPAEVHVEPVVVPEPEPHTHGRDESVATHASATADSEDSPPKRRKSSPVLSRRTPGTSPLVCKCLALGHP